MFEETRHIIRATRIAGLRRLLTVAIQKDRRLEITLAEAHKSLRIPDGWTYSDAGLKAMVRQCRLPIQETLEAALMVYEAHYWPEVNARHAATPTAVSADPPEAPIALSPPPARQPGGPASADRGHGPARIESRSTPSPR